MGPDLPIYEVRPERGRGRYRVLHRNLFMSCDHLPFEKVPEKENHTRHTQKTDKPVAVVPDSDDEGSIDEYCCHYAPPQHSVPQPSGQEPLTAASQPEAPASALIPEPLAGDQLEMPDPAIVETTCKELEPTAGDKPLPLSHLSYSRGLRRRHLSGHSERDTHLDR